MPVEQPTCRLCGSALTRKLGTLPDSDFFAGQVLDTCLKGGGLWSCGDCASMFRHPVLRSDQYLSLYRTGAPDQWSGDKRREDLRIIRSIVAGARVRCVLDVGCGSGDFLATLADEFSRCGIEPSPAAAVAARRGIEIVAVELSQCPPERRFDAVTIIDVIEHVAEPAAFLTQAYQHVASEGLLIVSTGNPDTGVWRRWFKSRFWYASFPEHLSFPAAGFFQHWCRQAGAEMVERHETRYQRMHPLRRVLGVVIQSVFALHPGAFNLLGRSLGAIRGNSRRRMFSPGIPGTFVDHHIVVIRKPQA